MQGSPEQHDRMQRALEDQALLESKFSSFMAALDEEQPKDQQTSAASFRSKIFQDAKLLQEEEVEKEALRKLHERLSQFPPSVREKAKAKLLQREEDEEEALRRLHERSGQFPPSVVGSMTAKHQKTIESSLKTLQQGPAITAIATTEGLLDELRGILLAAEAEALQQMRVQAQNELTEQNKEIDRLNAENQELRAHVTELKRMDAEKYNMVLELAPRVHSVLQKTKKLMEKNKGLTDTVTESAPSSKVQLT
ncbi:hypothetical protein KC316_g383 [Hortaea werneckii]|nr:hypothetical protein KC324_g425 [Hortaea werneckii]KAI7595663.1 hypothetical protein KC316_g383 [Hortaea werneckii]